MITMLANVQLRRLRNFNFEKKKKKKKTLCRKARMWFHHAVHNPTFIIKSNFHLSGGVQTVNAFKCILIQNRLAMIPNFE